MLTRTIALAAVTFVQAVNQSPRELLHLERPLTNAEIAIVLRASRAALASKSFRLSFGSTGSGAEVLMAPTGLPRLIRITSTMEGGIVYAGAPGTSAPPPVHWIEQVTAIADYTGQPARRCDGSPTSGEMVIEYEGRGAPPVWTVSARSRDARDVGGPGFAPVFAMLGGDGPIASGESGEIAGRRARSLVSPWVSPYDQRAQPPRLIGDPIPNVRGDRAPSESLQSLWIDAESLLPLRWEATGDGATTHSFDFTYERIDLQPPAGVDAPACIR